MYSSRDCLLSEVSPLSSETLERDFGLVYLANVLVSVSLLCVYTGQPLYKVVLM